MPKLDHILHSQTRLFGGNSELNAGAIALSRGRAGDLTGFFCTRWNERIRRGKPLWFIKTSRVYEMKDLHRETDEGCDEILGRDHFSATLHWQDRRYSPLPPGSCIACKISHLVGAEIHISSRENSIDLFGSEKNIWVVVEDFRKLRQKLVRHASRSVSRLTLPIGSFWLLIKETSGWGDNSIFSPRTRRFEVTVFRAGPSRI